MTTTEAEPEIKDRLERMREHTRREQEREFLNRKLADAEREHAKAVRLSDWRVANYNRGKIRALLAKLAGLDQKELSL